MKGALFDRSSSTSPPSSMSDDPFPQQLPTLERLGVDEPTLTSATELAEVATAWFNAFSSADTLALTWDFRTIEGRDAIRNLLDRRLAPTGFVDLWLCHEPFLAPQLLKLFLDLVLLRLSFEFGTKVGRGTAVCHLVPIGPLRRHAAEHGIWEERRRREVELADGDPIVIVIGAGHSGLEVAARLKYLGVPYLVIDKKARVDDNWRDRYNALCLHTTIWFPPTWPVFSPARKLTDWLEGYANYFELNVWTSSRRKGHSRTLRVKHLVFATGFGGHPTLPDIPGKGDFKGETVHSSEFASAANYNGKRAVVVGTCTSGHDIAQDFFNYGVDVTMYQRSSTHIISIENVKQMLSGASLCPVLSIVLVDGLVILYSDTIPTDVADVYHGSLPYALVRRIRQRTVLHTAQTTDEELLDGLAKVGFKTNLGPYGAGIFQLLFGNAGGYCIDTGTSRHIIDGDIKIKSRSAIERFTEKGLKFVDGTELEADIVVFATGYGDPRDTMRDICRPQADKVNKVWDFTEEGEVSGVWRHCGHEGLWFGVGEFELSRYHNCHLALQIKAIEVGILKRSEIKF
ncbi:hypothetical protein JVT61DRAFT_12548 [Boletus reticuloceps]|uniref:Flavin-containing monooxygenase n=1 Tax=Boletus reticuloceps TaxID=495285 RepID=A0A8I2YDP8_9AGAM|nr:hypothetical protein JVT61DRAFT_12548 [Boletus reticuloceps]